MEQVTNILPAIIDDTTSILIVGSMPGIQSLEKQQYYGNPRNHFWAIMSELLETTVPEKYEDRLKLLKANRIGLWDVIKNCERKGSLDSAIKKEIPNDFETLFETYPSIQCVVFNGGKAYDVFRKKVGLSLLDERVYYKMPSTSPVPGKHIQTFEQKIKSYSVIKQYL